MFTCNVCSKDVHADDRAAHYCTHLKKELVPFICPECKLRAISRPAFERHLRYSHERSRNWNELREKAFNCNQTYNWEESFSKKGVSLNLSNDPHLPTRRTYAPFSLQGHPLYREGYTSAKKGDGRESKSGG